MATPRTEEELGTCAVCRTTFRDPKALPCHHAFCAQCIAHVANLHSSGTFPCPTCTEPTSLPVGGVAALGTIFSINRQESHRNPLKRKFCAIHPDKALVFYCMTCARSICIECKLKDHDGHGTEDLHKAVEKKKRDLLLERSRLLRAVAELIQRKAKTVAEQKAVEEKRSAVEKNIYDRHALMVAAADKFRDEALGSLRSVGTDIQQNVSRILQQQDTHLNEIRTIHQQLEDALSSRTGTDFMAVCERTRYGPASEQATREMASQEISTICRPVLCYKVTNDVLLGKARDFLGTVWKAEIKVSAPKMKVVTRLRCGDETDIEVFCLCHDDENLRVSYEVCGSSRQASVKRFCERGKLLDTCAQTGKVTFKRLSKGKTLSLPQESGSLLTLSKSLSAGHYKLKNNLSGSADISKFILQPGDVMKDEYQFTINVGPHRAFDVDDTEQFFVVVEEPQLPDVWRKVKLYRRQDSNPLDTYTPPPTFANFQPSDVCFYKLGRRPVLLVTDEVNDAVHVVFYSGGCPTAIPLLVPGCPWLIQPTAITVDVSARLWLACRGGTIICMEPVD
ncbi:tripartite motif-containing protein 59-like [Littorina saxatilis]|uniref:Uncharacterized protein n=1 Tax=Littorina saxatilis TaxID=31220 RepID=A0AAN9AK45_9CAEN